MNSPKRIIDFTGWLVFAIAATVFFFSAEPTGSLWDCGEFILGAYKLQVVHPPGAPLFLLVGRVFTWIADIFSDNPENIAYSINLLSGLCTAFGAMFICWTTIMLGKLTLMSKEETPSLPQTVALAGAGLVAGLATAFTSSVWFSAVEGEVYAMSTFFTTLTLWSVIKWYMLPDNPQSDRWLIFAFYAAGLSIGVHLLSILTFPALAIFYYHKKYKDHTFLGMLASAAVGVVIIVAIQTLIIVGIPKLWGAFELFTVNGMGMPFHSGLIPTLLVILAVVFFGLRYAHQKKLAVLQYIIVSAMLVMIGFSTIGVIVVRANADPPINMNDPSDAMRLIPYLNREQYGERPLLRGPHFNARPVDTETKDRYGQVDDGYDIVDYKVSYVYDDADKVLFPRMGDYQETRYGLYKQWMGLNPNEPLPPGRPNGFDNLRFFWQYQIGWMYWRYFMWNFSGRQNGVQGYYPWDKSSGHWISGIPFLDRMRLYNQSELPETAKTDQSRNTYYMLPFLFGLVGLFFHFSRSRNEAYGLLALFVITGIGIIIYSNQPPNEPRERDYVLAASFFTYCIWIGMAVLGIFEFVRSRMNQAGLPVAVGASALVLVAPLLMGFENYDDHSRADQYGARDYAANFLNSCEENAIIFTYGDNDTYPLWYAQEVEGIRTDVRVVNLSLIAVDWYIDLLRRQLNESAPIKMTIPREAYRGKKRNQVFYYNPSGQDKPMNLQAFIKFIGEKHPLRAGAGREIESYYPTKNVFIPVNQQRVRELGLFTPADSAGMVSRIPVKLPNREYLIKDELAILDIIASNLWERPIYFAVTTRQSKLFGLDDYMQLEGLALRIMPVKSESDPVYGIIGSGRVAPEIVYENVMNKFRWGNFDKKRLYVDHSYAPSIQSHQLAIRRAAFAFLKQGERDKAIELVNKYFEAFPHMNFRYDYRTMYMLAVLFQADAYEEAKPHMEILAQETTEYLAFYDSIDPSIIESSFRTDYALAYQTMEDLIREVEKAGDTAFLEELKAKFAAYKLDVPEGQGGQSFPMD